ncbi:putative quinol monooxygenase [Ferrimonas pelagia]|uniref:Antibiotic biosynthesis monooxygenase n=1 Tax=Ferrimonas pelagia TaxID=1177826 RepID=A0ABP9EJ75_9GAMM
MNKVILKGHILIPKEALAAVEAALPQHTALTLNEPGCLIFQVSQDPNNPQRFDVYEAFVDKAAFESHQHRIQHANWGQITQQAQRHYELSA